MSLTMIGISRSVVRWNKWHPMRIMVVLLQLLTSGRHIWSHPRSMVGVVVMIHAIDYIRASTERHGGPRHSECPLQLHSLIGQPMLKFWLASDIRSWFHKRVSDKWWIWSLICLILCELAAWVVSRICASLFILLWWRMLPVPLYLLLLVVRCGVEPRPLAVQWVSA